MHGQRMRWEKKYSQITDGFAKKQSLIFGLYLLCIFSQSIENKKNDSLIISADSLYLHTWNGVNTVVRFILLFIC